MHPPHRPKRNESGRKITLNFGEDLFFFFGDHLILAKKTFEFPISAEKSLSILVKTSEFLRFCASNPPPPKFSGSATGPWPWLRVVLSLASRGSVLARAVLGFGLEFF